MTGKMKVKENQLRGMTETDAVGVIGGDGWMDVGSGHSV